MKAIIINEEMSDNVIPTEGTIVSDNNSSEMPTDNISLDKGVEIDNNINNQTANVNTDKVLPPPPRSNYDYNIVPYYIPTGINPFREPYYIKNRRGYRDTLSVYADDFYGGKNFILRDYEEGEFDFTDDTPGLYAKMGNIRLSAGSESGKRNIIKVKIGKDKYIKSFKTVYKTRKLFLKLVDVLYYDREYFFSLLLKYKFRQF